MARVSSTAATSWESPAIGLLRLRVNLGIAQCYRCRGVSLAMQCARSLRAGRPACEAVVRQAVQDGGAPSSSLFFVVISAGIVWVYTA
jgi:hypothetical protein